MRYKCFIKRKNTNYFLVAIVAIIFISSFFGSWSYDGYEINDNIFYSMSTTSELEEEIKDEIADQLQDLDFSSIDEYLSKITDTTLFSSSFVNTVKNLINGEYSSSQSFLSSVLSLIWDGILDYLPIIATIIAVSILGGIVASLKSDSGGIGNVIHFVTYGIMIVYLGATISHLVIKTTSTLTNLSSFMDAVFPVLLTLLTAVGGTTSVSLYQPAVAMMSNVFIYIINHFLMPLFIFSIVFSIVGNLSNTVKLDKFTSFLTATFKWTIGLMFTLFLGFVSIQGISASAVDGLSIRTAKYTLKSYIPIIGGYVSDGLSIILASTMLIKSAVGTAGLLFVLFSVVSPVVNLILFSLSLKLMAGFIEPIGDKKSANFISNLSSSIGMLIALIVAVAFMYMVLVGLIMCSVNLL